MKKIVLVLLICFNTIFLYSQSNYYWYQGEKVFLKENNSKQFALFINTENEDTLSQHVVNAKHVEKLEKEYTLKTIIHIRKY